MSSPSPEHHITFSPYARIFGPRMPHSKRSFQFICHNDCLPRSPKTPLRDRISVYLDTTYIGSLWTLFDAIINALLCIVYIFNTRHIRTELPGFNFVVELVLTILLLIQWIPKFYITRYRSLDSLVRSPFPVLTMLTVVPIFALWGRGLESLHYLVFLMPFRFLRCYIAIRRCLVVSEKSVIHLTEVKAHILLIFFTIIFLILTCSVLLHGVEFVENDVEALSFFDAIFFTTISCSTIGYLSDIVPDGVFPRVLLLVIFATGLIFMPYSISELMIIVRSTSPYERPLKRPARGGSHVILVAPTDLPSLRHFLREFYSFAHGEASLNTKAVILNPAEPAPTLQTFLKDPVYNRRVQYIKGSGLSWQSLEKIQAHTASAYFILAKKFTAQSETIDAENVLRAMALSKYGCSDKLYLQCILPENKIHFENLHPRQIICIDELKLGIFAHSCLTPGFATLIYTLTTSFTNESAEELRFLRNLDNQNKMHIGVDSAIIVDYVRGCAQSIHTTKLSTFFRGLKFWEISELCFTHVGVVLFGLGIRRDERDPLTIDLRRRRRRGSFSGSDRWQTHATNDDDYRNYNVLLNPDDYVVQGGEVAFVVASDEAEAARVASYGLQMERQAVAFDEFENERTSLLKRGKAKAQTDSFAVSQSQGISGQNATFEYLPGLATKPLPVPCRPIPSFTIEDDGQTQRRDHIQTGHRARAMSVPLTSVIGTDSIKTSHQKHSHQFNSRVTSFPGGLPMSPVLLPHNIGSEEATSSLIEHLQDHIVLCDYSGSFPRNLDCFIRPLRKCHLDRFLPVVILCPSRPNQGQWKMLAEFDQVYLIQANPMTREGLNSARIAQARYAVVLTDSTRILKDGEKTEDAPATLVYLNIRALNPSAHIFVEYIHTENTKLMKAFALGRDLQAFNTPAFMSGSVFTVSMLDSIICQSYYQPHLVTILQHLLFGAPPHHLASGKTCPAPSHSHVFQAHVPAAFVGLGYAMLFRYMVRQRRAVPLGLYRTTKLNDNEWYTEAESEELMYVFTCPPGDTILRENDEVFILCRRDPSVERDGVTEL